MLTRFGVVCLWVYDFALMQSYYQEVLQLPLSGIQPGEGYEPGKDWARFELEGTALELFAMSRSPKRESRTPLPRQNSAVLCFLVADFEAEQAELSSRGVSFSSVGAQEWGKYAHFFDPEGNELQIYQPNPGY